MGNHVKRSSIKILVANANQLKPVKELITLIINTCEQKRCCIAVAPQPTSVKCISANDFDYLYNTSRSSYLRAILNYGSNEAGICNHCRTKAAFLTVAATMTENFQTDDITKSDGSRFRRRGFFGLQGRVMYQRLQEMMPQYSSLTNPELVALTQNAIAIASKRWINPDLTNEPPLTRYADGSFLWIFNVMVNI
ncbi:unnamed protein product [Rotaria magnacalcarata]|uniref:Uncharacterized protein n=1 Tax=Rotaria magnacalcarata TaxID=392030 RepID=A0A819Y8R1_9BILA|nr:unnamed protein product [Rotaria magnacalcarata]